MQIERGNYQISWAQGDRVGTAFDYHPYAIGLNARTNVYYMETRDQGATWTTASGQPLSVPLIPVKNPAPLPTLINELITDKGGDALIDVTSSSSWTFYLLGVANCLEVQGKVIRINQ